MEPDTGEQTMVQVTANIELVASGTFRYEQTIGPSSEEVPGATEQTVIPTNTTAISTGLVLVVP
jgi:hypothetical protein